MVPHWMCCFLGCSLPSFFARIYFWIFFFQAEISPGKKKFKNSCFKIFIFLWDMGQKRDILIPPRWKNGTKTGHVPSNNTGLTRTQTYSSTTFLNLSKMEASPAATAPTEANPATGTSSAGSSTNTCEDIKSRGNELFVKNDFAGAEELYTQAIDQFTDSRAILYTNRSAARLGLNNFTGALEDSERAIAADPTWTKAYYRKATALEKLNRHRDCYLAWRQAAILCEHTAWLQKQIKAASEHWRISGTKVPKERDSSTFNFC
jgi:tetratricopeptide (TPR) repeat protein